MQKNGKLYILPSALGETDATLFSEHYKKIVFELTVFIVENVRTARRFLRSVGYTKNFDDIIFLEIDKHQKILDWTAYLKENFAGKDTGLLSEAGTPGIADPGAEIIRRAHRQNVQVVPLIGPSSILLALSASGLNGQSFCFNGYLPIEKPDRTKKIKALEALSFKEYQTQIFIETPYRNNQLLADLLNACDPNTEICVAANLTIDKEYIKTKPVLEWRKSPPDIHKQPTVFLMLKR